MVWVIDGKKIEDIFIRFDTMHERDEHTAAISIFKLSEFGTLQRIESVVLELCIKYGSNICYSHWDRQTYASVVHLMTSRSRKLTSGLDFWSRRHLRMAVMHLPLKFGADIFIQSGVIDIFYEIQDGGCRHLGFSGYVNLTIPACW